MRPIKFRAWIHWPDRKTAQMYYGVERSYPLCNIIDKEYVNLMQFTGLTDKNGKEIYEGDILRTETDKPMVVGWSNKFASYVLNRSGWAFSHWFGEACDPENCEVIGNKHENPELLTNNNE